MTTFIENLRFSWVWWLTPVTPELWEAEAEGELEPKSLKPGWVARGDPNSTINKLTRHGDACLQLQLLRKLRQEEFLSPRGQGCTFWEAKVGGSQAQEIETILANMVFSKQSGFLPDPRAVHITRTGVSALFLRCGWVWACASVPCDWMAASPETVLTPSGWMRFLATRDPELNYHTCFKSALRPATGQIVKSVKFWEGFLKSYPSSPLFIAATYKITILGQAQWLTPVIPALWEAKAETGFRHVGQAGLELRTSNDRPASDSQSAGITGFRLLGRLRQENDLNPGGGGCSEPRSHHCTPAWQQNLPVINTKGKRIRNLDRQPPDRLAELPAAFNVTDNSCNIHNNASFKRKKTKFHL
ncbi:hypothetical protein AAY473_006885 [Plecturocebus cupreus]